MKRHVIAGLAALLLAAPTSVAQDEAEKPVGPSISVGDVMPTLTDVTWLKGEPVTEWEPGQIYVIDFWATWCGPCRLSMPHLNDLAKRYRGKGVTLIGAAIWPRSGQIPTIDWVKDHDAEMDYPIAEDIDRKTATAFMDAVGRTSIPSTMIIGRDGRLAWHGNPFFWVEEVLEAVVEGNYDAEAMQKMFDERLEEEDRTWGKVQEARRNGDHESAAAGIGRLIKSDPLRHGNKRVYRYEVMIDGGLLDDAAAWGRELVAGPLAKESAELNKLAWKIVDPTGNIPDSKQDLVLARLAADRANDLAHGKSASILDTVARVMFVQGEIEAAIETQQAAVDLTSGKTREGLQKVLDEYIAAREPSEV
jgi:thiol-disulfide isomerase/thioredoxin